ncbi:MAG: PEP/pyruvate-binding domain-containing protein [Pirellulaceae bacterium]
MTTTPTAADVDEQVLDYAACHGRGAAAAGGKAFSLACLHRYGFRVPEGFVLPAEHYLAALATEPLAAAAALADVDAEDCLAPRVKQQLEQIQAQWRETPLTPQLRESVRAALARHRLDANAVAVRSSAVGEDGSEHSFAGIHGSCLNVLGRDAVCVAIRDCWASLWTPTALAYRRRIGLDDRQAACAVLICRMVGAAETASSLAAATARPAPPRAAGVAFTCDPTVGRRDFVMINAVTGLADELVAGRRSPEQWHVDLRDVHPTPLRVAAGADGGDVLTASQSLALARLAERIQWAMGDGQRPQDIEWVYDGEKFWIVQARPVTCVPLNTLPAVRHLPVIWSNANVKDAVPVVLRPLSWSACKSAIDHILFSAQEAAGYAMPPGLEAARRIDGRVMLDLTLMQWAFCDSVGMTPRMFNEILGGHQPRLRLPPRRSWFDLAALRRLLRGVRLGRAAAKRQREFQQSCAENLAWALDVSRHEEFTEYDNPSLIRRMDEIDERSRRFGRQLMLAGIESSSQFLKAILHRYFADEGSSIAAGLLAGSGAVQSAEHGLRLFDLAQVARRSGAAREFLAVGHEDPQAWRSLPDDCPFKRQFSQFLDEFGHRAVYEVELANPRWCEDPRYLLDQVRMLLPHTESTSPRDIARQTRQRAEQRLTKLPFFLRAWVKRLARGAAAGGARREAGKSSMAAAAMTLRKAALEIGRRMVRSGVLADVDDVFFLTLSDLRGWLDGVWDGGGATSLVADRGAQQAQWEAAPVRDVVVLDAQGREVEFPQDAVSVADAARGETSRSVASSNSGERLRGVAASPGVYRGVARVISHPAEGARLARGEILVAPSTDPGWTPLLLRAGAIVMQVGGYLSHGAIVSREFGLPAVVNVEQALTRIADGQQVEVDGDRGEIRLG